MSFRNCTFITYNVVKKKFCIFLLREDKIQEKTKKHISITVITKLFIHIFTEILKHL